MSAITPANWPIYGVKLSDAQITELIQRIFPTSSITAITPVARTKSFNNRIYFLDLVHSTDENSYPTEAVLKVNGRFFGASKVQNEIACLLLLEKHCPNIPAPRVLAWSEDGSKICGIRNGVFSVLHDNAIDGILQPSVAHGWIIISKLEGRPLRYEELSEHTDVLVRQIAAIFADWRINIPAREVIGNLGIQPAGYASSNDLHGLETIVSGLPFCGLRPENPLTSLSQYYDFLLLDKINKLNTNPVYAKLREEHADDLERFRTETLPHLSLLKSTTLMDLVPNQVHSNKFTAVFTHQDFAPRNILVSENTTNAQKLKVTGILDFEFAGFFPDVEEFVTCMSRQSSDWDPNFFNAFLADLGVSIPKLDSGSSNFDSLCHLDTMIETIAPWQLESGDIDGRERDLILEKASRIVNNLVQYR